MRSLACLLIGPALLLTVLPAAAVEMSAAGQAAELTAVRLTAADEAVIGSAVWLPFVRARQAVSTPPPDWSAAQGSLVCLAGDPTNPDILYAGTWGGGVFRSEDQGETWQWASSGMSNYLIDALVVDPADPRILYAGTHAGGLYKSQDQGQHWLASGEGIQAGAAIYSLAVHPGNHKVLYAATRITGSGLNPPYNGVLYKSTDGGVGWYPVLTDVGGAGVKDWVYSLAVKADPPVVLAAAHESGPYLSASGEAGDWQPARVDGGDFAYGKGRAVAFDPRPESGAAFYATWHGGFYLSGDNGSTWRPGKDPLVQLKVYPNGIVSARQAPDIMFLAAMDTPGGVYRSADAGQSWAAAGLDGQQIYTVLALSDGDIVFAGTAGSGLYKSTDGGTTWSPSIQGMEIHPAGNAGRAAASLPPEPMDELRASP